ncbi:ABC transporter permease [Lentzea guizhouensis]|uniref:ABC transporter permease n=1 Tax=Lentzea guizhouensis TaxID=1586287 RepID=A0A1B2I0U2_9PSEU|nr:carbohydrate ABC transporter permease [Lentzea guizhouensis]ANZ43585.1 ABC transporter permease [Lentzea guizhouensis]
MRSSRWPVVVLAVVTLFALVPFVVMVLVALSPPGAPTLPHALPGSLTLRNFAAVLAAEDFARWTLNTLVYAVVSVAAVLLSASMAAYVFARKRFRGRDLLLWSIVSTLMVPFHAVVVPLLLLVAALGWVDTYWGLVVPTLANAQAVLLLRQFILALPGEVFDAVRVDGAGDWRTYWHVVLPLCRPVLATLGVFVFLWHWNDFLWPLVVTNSTTTRTLTLGLSTMDSGKLGIAELMSAATVTALPCLLVFWLLQRHLAGVISGRGR